MTYNSVPNFKIIAQPLVGEKYVGQKEKKKKSQYWTLCSAATPKGSARTLLGPKNISTS
jgi:hypothetical protein